MENKLCCIVYELCRVIRTHRCTVLKFVCWFSFRFRLACLFRFAIYVFLCRLRSFYSFVTCFCCWISFLQFQAKTLADKNVSEMTYSLSSGK